MLKAKEMFPTEEKRSSLEHEVKDEQLEWLYNQIKDKPCGLVWLLSPESAPVTSEKVPSIDCVLTSAELQAATDKAGLLLSLISLTKEEVAKVQKLTSGQVRNPRWFVARKGKLTSSNFGLVLKAIAKGRYPKSLFKRLLGGYDASSSAAVKWGQTHESAAKEAYEAQTGKKCRSVAFFSLRTAC